MSCMQYLRKHNVCNKMLHRLSRARRVIKNSFGILKTRWRLLLDTGHAARPFHQCCAVLRCSSQIFANKKGFMEVHKQPIWCFHYIVKHHIISNNLNLSNSLYYPMGFVDIEDVSTGRIIQGTWRTLVDNTICQIECQASNNYSIAASNIRRNLDLYFSSVGAIPWQYERALFH